MIEARGIGPFDNDVADDFMIEVEEAPTWDAVRDAFNGVLENEDFVELNDGARAYAAGALLTVALGKSDVSAQDYYMILDDLGPPPAELLPIARAALKRLSTGDSEIRELHLDRGAYNEWVAIVETMSATLAA